MCACIYVFNLYFNKRSEREICDWPTSFSTTFSTTLTIAKNIPIKCRWLRDARILAQEEKNPWSVVV